MNKGNAWPWVISLCIHAIVLYFLFSQSIKVAPPKEEKNAIIQAYVTVNLVSLPKLSSVVTTTNAPDIKPVNTKTDGERFFLKARTFKNITGLNEGLTLKTTQGVTIILSVLLVVILFWFLNHPL